MVSIQAKETNALIVVKYAARTRIQGAFCQSKKPMGEGNVTKLLFPMVGRLMPAAENSGAYGVIHGQRIFGIVI